MFYGLIQCLILSAFISPSATLCDNNDDDGDGDEEEEDEEGMICTPTLFTGRKS